MRRSSPLTDMPAKVVPIGKEEEGWLLVREEDGLEYVFGDRLSPRSNDEAKQLLLVAEHHAARGGIVVFVRDGDRGAFDAERPDLGLRKRASIWIVRD